jgi:serine/threonine protein kinase
VDLREILLEHTFKASIEKEVEGTLGRIFIFRQMPHAYPERFAVKTVEAQLVPRKTTHEALHRFSHELHQWIRYRHHQLILTPFFTAFAQEWPYVALPYCELNVRDYISSIREGEVKSEAVALMVQILEALCYARSKGLLAHQDLKPENILLQNLRARSSNLPTDYPFAWKARVADFGLANAYKELEVNSGSRPYLAPEQYEEGTDLEYCDVFACGVIFHEILTGLHPLGFVTSDLWPKPGSGNSKQSLSQKKWKRWARQTDKLTAEQRNALGPFGDLIESTLAVEPTMRPQLAHFKAKLVEYLRVHDPCASNCLSVLLEHYNSSCVESEALGDTDERYQQKNMELLTRRHLD